jgi:spermidine/putrescine transport system substrate-binding protein
MSDQKLDEMIERALSRRGFMAAAGTTGAAAFLAACGGSTATKTATSSGGGTKTAAKAAAPSGTLLYYNWADYVNPKTYPAFTKATGVKIKKDFFKANEELQAKLQGGAKGYDLAAPTGYMVQILADAGLLEPIDWTLIPHVTANIDPKFQGLPYDPDNKWSVPKDWGTTGFMYRSDKVKERPTSWKEFFALAKGPYSGKVTLLDGIPEVIGSTAVMLGYSYNTEDPKELDAVKKELIALKPHIQSITSTTYKQSLIAGKTYMSLGWNGDGAAAAVKAPVNYVVADEGGEFWVDAYVIPAGAGNARAAHAWIDYVYDPAHNALETEYTYYGSPVKRELLKPVIDPKVFHNASVFPAESKLTKLEPNKVSAKGNKLRNRIWTEFKAA